MQFPDTTYTSRLDTLVIYDVPPELLNTYLDILQNTNSQLSLSQNPLALAIGFLGVLFTIAAIAAGWFIYRQGRDFKENQESLLHNSQVKFDEMSARLETSHQEVLERRIEDINQLYEQFKLNLKHAHLPGNENLQAQYEAVKDQMNKLVNEGKLLRRIEKVYDRQTNSVVNFITCDKCGHKKEFKDPLGKNLNFFLDALNRNGELVFHCDACKSSFKVV